MTAQMQVNRCGYHRFCLGVCKKNIHTKCKWCGNSPDYFPHWTDCWLKCSSTPLSILVSCQWCNNEPLQHPIKRCLGFRAWTLYSAYVLSGYTAYQPKVLDLNCQTSVTSEGMESSFDYWTVTCACTYSATPYSTGYCYLYLEGFTHVWSSRAMQVHGREWSIHVLTTNSWMAYHCHRRHVVATTHMVQTF